MSLLLLFHPGASGGPQPEPEPTPTAVALAAGGGYQQGTWRARAAQNRALGAQDAEDLLALARAALEYMLRGGR